MEAAPVVRPGARLAAGDVVAFLDESGRGYVASPDTEATGEPAWFAPGASDALGEPLCHLVVYRGAGGELGFKSADANNRFIQPRKRGRARIAAAGSTFGVNEQWEVDGVDVIIPPVSPARARQGSPATATQWASAPLLALRSRRYPEFKLSVKVLRVPNSRVTSATAAASAAAANLNLRDGGASPLRSRPMTAPVPPAVRASADFALNASSPGQVDYADVLSEHATSHARDAAAGEQGSVMSAMSGLLVREWSTFVLKEVRARQKVDREIKDIGEELSKCQRDMLAEIDAVKLAMHEECQRTLLEAWRRQERMRVRRATRRLLASVVHQWRTVVLEEASKRANIYYVRIAGRMQRIVNAWREAIDYVRFWEHTVWIARRRFASARASAYFRAWHASSRMARIRNHRIARIVTRALLRTGHAAFIAWADKAQGAAWVRARMIGAYCKHVKNKRRYCFDAWSGQLMLMRRLRYRMAKIERVRARRTMYEAFRTMKHRVVERLHRLSIARRFMYYNRVRRNNVLMQEWHEHAQYARRNRSRARRALLTLGMRTSHIAFQAWVEWTARCVRNVRVTRRYMFLWTSRKANLILQEWFEATIGSRVYASRVRKQRDRVRRRSLLWGMEAFVQAHLLARRQRHAARKFMYYNRVRRNNVLMQEWHEHAQYARRNRSRARRALLTLGMRTSHIAFQAWTEWTARRVRNVRVTRRYMFLWTSRKANLILQEWFEATIGSRVYASRVRKQRDRVRRRSLLWGMEAFVQAHLLARRQRHAARKFMYYNRVRRNNVLMQEWHELARWLHRNRLRARKALYRMSTQRNGLIFAEWHEVVRRSRRNSNKLRRYLFLMGSRRMEIAMLEWCELARHRLRRNRKLRTYLYFMTANKLRFVLMSWQHDVLTARAHRRRVLTMYRARMKKLLTFWRGVGSRDGSAHLRVAAVKMHLRRVRKKHVFYTWFHFKTNRVEKKKLLLKFLSKKNHYREVDHTVESERLDEFKERSAKDAARRRESLADVRDAYALHAGIVADALKKTYVSVPPGAGAELARVVAQSLPAPPPEGGPAEGAASATAQTDVADAMRKMGRLELAGTAQRRIAQMHLTARRGVAVAAAARLVDPKVLLKAGLDPNAVVPERHPRGAAEASLKSAQELCDAARVELAKLREDLMNDIDEAKMKVFSLEKATGLRASDVAASTIVMAVEQSEERVQMVEWSRKLEVASKRLAQLNATVGRLAGGSKMVFGLSVAEGAEASATPAPVANTAPRAAPPSEPKWDGSADARGAPLAAAGAKASAVSRLAKRFETTFESTPERSSTVSPGLASARQGSTAAARAVAVQRELEHAAAGAARPTQRANRATAPLPPLCVSRSAAPEVAQRTLDALMAEVATATEAAEEFADTCEKVVVKSLAKHAALTEQAIRAIVRHNLVEAASFEAEAAAIAESLAAAGEPVDDAASVEGEEVRIGKDARECIERLIALIASSSAVRDEAEAAAASMTGNDGENSGGVAAPGQPADPEAARQWASIAAVSAKAAARAQRKLDRLLNARKRVAESRMRASEKLSDTLVSLDPVVHDRVLASQNLHAIAHETHKVLKVAQERKAVLSSWRAVEAACTASKELAAKSLRDAVEDTANAARAATASLEECRAHAAELRRKGLTNAYERAVALVRATAKARDDAEALAGAVAAIPQPEPAIALSKDISASASDGFSSTCAFNASDVKHLLEKAEVGVRALARDRSRLDKMVESRESDEFSMLMGLVAEKSVHMTSQVTLNNCRYALVRGSAAVFALCKRRESLATERARVVAVAAELRQKADAAGGDSTPQAASALAAAEEAIAHIDAQEEDLNDQLDATNGLVRTNVSQLVEYELALAQRIHRFAELGCAKTTGAELEKREKSIRELDARISELYELESQYQKAGKVDKEDEARKDRVAAAHKLELLLSAEEEFDVTTKALMSVRLNIVRLDRERRNLQMAIEFEEKSGGAGGANGIATARSPAVQAVVADLERYLAEITDAKRVSESWLNKVTKARDDLRRAVTERGHNLADSFVAEIAAAKAKKAQLESQIEEAIADGEESKEHRAKTASLLVEASRMDVSVRAKLTYITHITDLLMKQRDWHHSREAYYRNLGSAFKMTGDGEYQKFYETHRNNHANEARAYQLQYASLSETLQGARTTLSTDLKDYEGKLAASLAKLDAAATATPESPTSARQGAGFDFFAADNPSSEPRTLRKMPSLRTAAMDLRNLLVIQCQDVQKSLEQVVHVSASQAESDVAYGIERALVEKQSALDNKRQDDLLANASAVVDSATSLAQLDAVEAMRLQRVMDKGGDAPEVAQALGAVAFPSSKGSAATASASSLAPGAAYGASQTTHAMVPHSPKRIVHTRASSAASEPDDVSALEKDFLALQSVLAAQAATYTALAQKAAAANDALRSSECSAKAAECLAAAQDAKASVDTFHESARSVEAEALESKIRAVAELGVVLDKVVQDATKPAAAAAAAFAKRLGESRDAIDHLSEQMMAVKVLEQKQEKLEKLDEVCKKHDKAEEASLLEEHAHFLSNLIQMRLLGQTKRERADDEGAPPPRRPALAAISTNAPEAEQRAHMHSELNKQVNERVRISIMRKALDSWYIVQERRLFHATRIAHYRLVRTRIKAPFREWSVRHAARMHKERVLGKARRRVATVVMKTVLAHWLNLAVARRREMDRHMGAVESGMRRATWRCLRKAFAEWEARTAGRRRAVLMARRAIAAAMHGTMRRAFVTLREAAQTRTNRKVAAAKCLARVLTSLAWRVFHSWKMHARFVTQSRSLVRLALARLAAKSATITFLAWRDHIDRRGLAAMKKRKAIAHWRRKLVAAAVYGWRVEQESGRQFAMRLRRAVRRINLRSAAAMFRYWADVVAAKNATRARVRAVIARMLRFGAMRALNAWIDVALNRRSQHEALGRLWKAKQTLIRWSTFGQWKQLMVVRKEKQRLLLMAVRRIVKRREALCFEHWSYVARHRLQTNAKVGDAVMRMLHGVTWKSFLRWREAAQEAVRRARLVRAFRSGSAKNLASIFLHGWLDLASEIRAERRQMRRAWVRLSVRTLRLVLRRWLEAAYAQKRGRDEITNIARKHGRMVLRKALHRWAERGALTSRNRKRARAAFARMRRALLRQVLKIWRDAATIEQRIRSTLIKAGVRRMAQWGTQCLHAWWSLIEKARRMKDKLRRCVTAKRLVTQWFLGWYWNAYDDEIRSALRLLYGSAEGAMDSLYGEGGGDGSPVGLARIRGIGGGGYSARAARRPPSEDLSSVGKGLEDAVDRSHAKALQRASQNGEDVIGRRIGKSPVMAARYGNAAAAAAAAASARKSFDDFGYGTPPRQGMRSPGRDADSPNWEELTNRLNV